MEGSVTSVKAKKPPKKNGAGYAVTVAFDLMDGALPEFHRQVSENASLSVEREPGCLRFDVLTPLEEGASPQIFLYEIYTDRAAFDVHLASDHYKSLRSNDTQPGAPEDGMGLSCRRERQAAWGMNDDRAR